MTDHEFPKRARILLGRDFDRVFAARASAADGLVVLYGAENGRNFPRLGLAVSRRVGPAVVRNRWKRLLREVFRLTQHELPALDIVCVPRPAATPDFAGLAAALPKLAQQIQGKIRNRSEQPKRPSRSEESGT